MWLVPAAYWRVPGSEARFYRHYLLITHALEAYAPRRPLMPILFMAGWPLDSSLVPDTHAGLQEQCVRKPDSYAAVEQPLRLALPGI